MLAQGKSQSPVYAWLRLYQLSSPTGSAENLEWSERLEFNSLHSLESKQINHVKESMPQLPPGDTQGSFMLSEQQSLHRYPGEGTKHSKIVQSEPYHCGT